MFAERENFVTADPKQIGTVANGFALPKDSPAWKMGFQPIAFEQIGLQANADRQRIKNLAEKEAPVIKAVARTDETWRIAHEQLLAKAKQGRIDVYFVGDSITRRWGATDLQYRPVLSRSSAEIDGGGYAGKKPTGRERDGGIHHWPFHPAD